MARLKAFANAKVEKTEKGNQQLQKKISTPDKIEANISQTCSNCHQVPCLSGQSVRDITKVVVGCRLLTVKCPYFKGINPQEVTVEEIHIERQTNPIRVRWEDPKAREGRGLITNCPLPSRAKPQSLFTYNCMVDSSEHSADIPSQSAGSEDSETATPKSSCSEESETTTPQSAFSVDSEATTTIASSCSNCRQLHCLDAQPLTDIQKLSVGCRLLTTRNKYFSGGPSQMATVTQIRAEGNPVRVEFDRGVDQGKGRPLRKVQNFPMPTKADHDVLFIYYCKGMTTNKPMLHRRGGGGGSTNVRPGDWQCQNQSCGNICFAWRTECNMCNVPRGGAEDFYTARGGAASRGRAGQFRL